MGIKSSKPFVFADKKVSFVNSETNVLPLDTSTLYFYQNVLQNQGTISFNTLRYVDEFVVSLKRYGIWDKINEMGVFCGNNLNAALTKLKHQGSSLMTGGSLVSADFSERGASGGIKGDGSSKYINTGYAGGYSNTNGHVAAYVGGFDANGVSKAYLSNGNAGGTIFTALAYFNGGTTEMGQLYGDNSGNEYCPQNLTTQMQGLNMVTTNNSNSQVYYNRGLPMLASVTVTTKTSLTDSIYLLCRNLGGVTSLYSVRYMRFYSCGLGMSLTEASNFNAAVQLLQTRLNRAV